MKKAKKIFEIFLITLVSIYLILFYLYIKNIDIIPSKYLTIFIVVILLLHFLSIILIFGRRVAKFFSVFFIIVNISLTAFVVYYFNGLNQTLSSITEFQEKETYNLIANKNSKIKNMNDLNNKTICILKNNSLNYKKILEDIKRSVKVNIKEYDDMNLLVTDLLNNKIEVVLINTNNKKILEENIVTFKEKVKSIEDISINVVKQKEKEYKNKYGPFNILISGIDTDGNINKTSRSDVNIVLSVNQKQHKILLTNIPRDTYVSLHGTNGKKDKLTHAGMYGINMSRKTLEDFLQTAIPYYIRVNFDSVVKIIDALGGIDVYNKKAFQSYLKYFPAGNLHLTGEEALAYSRERHNLPNGDIDRGVHQEEVIHAIINKVSNSKELLSNYANFMKIIGSSIQTNIGEDTIKKYIKDQIESMPKWQFDKISVKTSGEDFAPTYSMPGIKLYVLKPDENSRIEVSKRINELIEFNKEKD